MPDYVTPALAVLRSISEDAADPSWTRVTRAQADAVDAIPARYRKRSNGTIVEMDAAEKVAADATALAAARDAIVAKFDEMEDILRAYAMVQLDDRNTQVATKHNDLLAWLATQATLTNRGQLTDLQLPMPTLSQLKSAMRGVLGS